MKKIIILFLVFLMTGCAVEGGSTPSSNQAFQEELLQQQRERVRKQAVFQAQEIDILTFGLTEPPSNYHPLYAEDLNARHLLETLYRTLYVIHDTDQQPNIQDSLATVTIRDHQVASIRLKEGQYWHDGKPITTKDVLYTLDQVMKSNDTVYGTRFSKDFIDIEIEEKGKDELELRLDKPSPYLFEALSQLLILPEHIYREVSSQTIEKDDTAWQIGSGPYKIKTIGLDEVTKTERYDLEFFEDSIYNKPEFERIAFRVSAREKTNRFDLVDYFRMHVGTILPTEYHVFDRELIEQVSLDQGEDHWLYYNLHHGATKDPEVRQALRAIISPGSVRGYLGTTDAAAYGNSFFGLNNIGKVSKGSFYTSDMTMALETLKTKQIENDDFVIRYGFLIGKGEFQERYAVILQESFRQYNLPLELVPLFLEEIEEALSDPEQDLFDILFISTPAEDQPEAYRELTFSKGVNNTNGYANEELDDKWMELSGIDADTKSYVQHLMEIEKILESDLPVAPLLHTKAVFVYDDRLTQVEESIPSKTGYFRFIEKLGFEEQVVTQEQLDEVNLSEEDLKPEYQYENVNIRQR